MGEIAVIAPGPRRVRIILTGFGSFFGVPANPTEKLLKYLELHAPEYLQGTAQLAACKVLKVAAHEIEADLEQLSASLVDPDDGHVVWIHLGVNVRAEHFDLEHCAYNEATFRCPDQGEPPWQPNCERINRSAPLGDCMRTDLPVADLAEVLSSDSGGQYVVRVSEDPGRFVCNFLFYSSLWRGANRSRWHALFVHVPEFSTIREELQQQFALGLLKRIAELPALRGAAEVSVPAAAEAFAPAAGEVYAPAAGEVYAPAAGEIYSPAAGEIYAPAAGEIYAPTAGEIYAPAAGEIYAPAAGEIYAPAAGEAYAPAAGEAYAPAAGEAHAQPEKHSRLAAGEVVAPVGGGIVVPVGGEVLKKSGGESRLGIQQSV